jgi:hypothetical protein
MVEQKAKAIQDQAYPNNEQQVLDEELAFQRVQNLILNFKQCKNFLSDFEAGKVIINDNNREYVMNETLHSKKLTIDGEYAYEIAQSSIMQKVFESIELLQTMPPNKQIVYPLKIES